MDSSISFKWFSNRFVKVYFFRSSNLKREGSNLYPQAQIPSLVSNLNAHPLGLRVVGRGFSPDMMPEEEQGFSPWPARHY